ncbi:MAG: hypothetical protein E4G96_08400 [Chrysiogenales bacterium]|nr:MAG: hypothetical protein E4G96_08400 [Chrysiogenales bacterium]
MESIEEFLIIFVRVVFLVLIPAVALFFRVKRKITNGFTVGVIITSFLLGILISGSISEDPVKAFIRVINTGDEVQSKTALKRVIQLEGDAYRRIDETKITRPDLYKKPTSGLEKNTATLRSATMKKAGNFPRKPASTCAATNLPSTTLDTPFAYQGMPACLAVINPHFGTI